MFSGSGLLYPKRSIMIEKGGITDIFQTLWWKIQFLAILYTFSTLV